MLREDKYKDIGDDIKSTLINFGQDDYYEYDGGNEEWADSPDLYIDVPFFEKNPDENQVAYYYIDVEDESAKMPLNNHKITLEMIAHLLELTGVEDEDDAKQLAAAIIDWRDEDDIPTDVGGRSGVGRDGSSEYEFYNPRQARGRRNMTIPDVIIKNNAISTMDELLLVPGMTPEILYGTVDPDAQDNANRYRSRRTRRGEYLGLRNYCTVMSGMMNLNTVKEEVLESILYPSQGEEAENIAQDWVKYRNGNDREPYTEDDQTIKTVDNSDMDGIHFTEVRGFTQQVYASLEGIVTISSNVFNVTCLAEYQGIQKGFKAIVGRDYIPWEALPIFGIDTINVEDLQQVYVWVRYIEPLFDAKKRIENVS